MQNSWFMKMSSCQTTFIPQFLCFSILRLVMCVRGDGSGCEKENQLTADHRSAAIVARNVECSQHWTLEKKNENYLEKWLLFWRCWPPLLEIPDYPRPIMCSLERQEIISNDVLQKIQKIYVSRDRLVALEESFIPFEASRTTKTCFNVVLCISIPP